MLKSEVVSVTPELAKKWLEKLGPKRPVSPTLVRKYETAMRRGQWIAKHPEGIVFDLNKNLIEGQHRLYAIIAYGKPVSMMVIYDAPLESAAVMNTGRARTISHRISIAAGGINDRGLTETIPRFAVGGYVSHPSSSPFDAKDYAEIFDKYRVELSEACRLYTPVRRGVSQASIRAATARALVTNKGLSADIDRIAAFAVIMMTGRWSGEDEDSAAWSFREYVLMHGSQGGNALFEIYGKAESALDAFLRGEPRNSATRGRVNRELFPIPFDESWLPKEMYVHNIQLLMSHGRRKPRIVA